MVEHDEKLKEIYKNVDYVDSLSYTSVNFKYNQKAQDEYNKKLKEDQDNERIWIEEQQKHYHTVKKTTGKWNLEMENKYNEGFGGTEIKKDDQERKPYGYLTPNSDTEDEK